MGDAAHGTEETKGLWIVSRAQQFIDAARQVAGGDDVRQAVGQAVRGRTGGGNNSGSGNDDYRMNSDDFQTGRNTGRSAGTRINSEDCALDDAAETLARSEYDGSIHVITPMVMPRGRRIRALIPPAFFAVIGLLGTFFLSILPGSFTETTRDAVFGPHFWVIVFFVAAFSYFRQGLVMVPEGCTALISRFGKVEAEVGPGRVNLWNPWKRVSYIVNTTREYPFNAPIRQAPTKSGVQASVDLFLQFRIRNAREFVFVLGAVNGFQDKLNNAISETTRSLIYEQEASGIYDLVGESTQRLLEQLNAQFAPAVELTTANITHAEPSTQEYRMDLAAPEMVRVAKEAYTYEYELQLRKEQNEGDLNRDLASLNESLSAIQADIARYQAQMDTALERETNRAEATARQRFVEAESTANANAALLDAQALDIRAMSAAVAPEVLEYTYQQDMLDKLDSLAEALPQIVRIGAGHEGVDFLQIARELVGGGGESSQLFTASDLEAIEGRRTEIRERIEEREDDIQHLLAPPEATQVEIVEEHESEAELDDERLEEIRRSVAGDSFDELKSAAESGELGESNSPDAPETPSQPETPNQPERPVAPEPPQQSGPTQQASPQQPGTDQGAPAAPTRVGQYHPGHQPSGSAQGSRDVQQGQQGQQGQQHRPPQQPGPGVAQHGGYAQGGPPPQGQGAPSFGGAPQGPPPQQARPPQPDRPAPPHAPAAPQHQATAGNDGGDQQSPQPGAAPEDSSTGGAAADFIRRAREAQQRDDVTGEEGENRE